jgi:lysophospholipase L1-like esterase
MMNFRWLRIIWLPALLGCYLIFAGCLGINATTQRPASEQWVTAWTTAPLAETPGKDTPPLRDATLKQVIRVTTTGRAVRVRIGNYFGSEPLVLNGACMSLVDGSSKTELSRVLYFGGNKAVSIPPREALLSDPIDCAVTARTDLAITLYITGLPATLTAHPGARATSFVTPGNAIDEAKPAGVRRTFTRWYFICGVDVLARDATALAILGDSITDGYGCPPDSYSRWPDELARRLHANPPTANMAVLNLGIGGNRLLRDGLGPKALTRIERDVFSQQGVTCLMIFLGINDIGTRLEARKKSEPYASATDIIEGLQQIADQARQRGLKVIGATITPYAGAGFYWSEDGDADRQAVNTWIRNSGRFDAIVDFDAILRDPQAPSHLAASFDSGDHLHPSVAGYAQMAREVDLTIFVPESHAMKSSSQSIAAPKYP